MISKLAVSFNRTRETNEKGAIETSQFFLLVGNLRDLDHSAALHMEAVKRETAVVGSEQVQAIVDLVPRGCKRHRSKSDVDADFPTS